MIKGDYCEPGASPSSIPHSNDMASNTGSSFQQPEHEGLALEAGAAVTMDLMGSMTDITLDQALTKLRDIDRENVLLKDHLADNNQRIQRQFEVLKSMNIKNKEKVEMFIALVSSLREENKELQMKVMSQEDREKENVDKITLLENETSLLQRQKKLSEQRIINVMKHAEVQGVTDLDDMDGLPDISDAVFVATEDKERELENLEASLANKEETISGLRNELVTVIYQRDQYKLSNEVLFKDMDGLQKQKEHLDKERRELHEHNVHLNKELDRLMQCNIASTRKEIEVQRHVVEEQKVRALDVSDFLNDPENLEEMFDQKLTLQQLQDDNAGIREDLEAQKFEKEELVKKLQNITSQFEQLKTQYVSVQEKVELLQKEKIKMSQEFEENLTSITHQRQENEKIQQAKVSEDQCALRSQVISLLSEVDELNKRLSVASMAIQQKDKRLSELTDVNSEWRDRFNEQWHQSSSTIQTLQTQLSQQESVVLQRTKEQDGTKQQYQSLQDNFNRLVTDYKDMLEMFENERSKTDHQGMSKEMMEEKDKMTAQVIAAEEAIKYRDTQLEECKIRIESMDENIKLLHIQLETYRTDFQTERDARTTMAQEKSLIEEELKKSQERVNLLKEEHNQMQLENIQRRVTQSQRPPSYTDAQRLYEYQHSMVEGNPPHQTQQHNAPALNLNNNNALYRPQESVLHYGYGQQGQEIIGQLADTDMEVDNKEEETEVEEATISSSAAREALTIFTKYFQQREDGNKLLDENQQLNAATRLASDFEDLGGGDQFPSLVPECPTCGAILPDTDSLQLHVADCLDRQ